MPVVARDAVPDPSVGYGSSRVQCGEETEGRVKFPQLLFPGGISRGVNPVQLLNPPKGACRRFWMLPFPKTLPGLQMAPSHQGCR